MLNLSGWHDEAYGPEGALTDFLGPSLRAADEAVLGRGSSSVRGSTAPPPCRIPTGGSARDRTFGAAAAIDYHETVLRFLDRYVRGLDGGVREPPVRVFVMGENAWGFRTGGRCPGPSPAASTWMAASGRAWAGSPARRARPTAPRPTSRTPRGRWRIRMPRRRARTTTGRWSTVPTSRVFETEPFEADLRVVGAITAKLYVSTDAPDVDVWVKLFDVSPDGAAFNLMSPGLDVLRASYSGGGRRDLLKRHRVYPLRFESLLTGNTFRKGHRLRLVVCSSFFPHFSRNLQTGELETDSARSRPARVSVHHGPPYALRLVLPVVP